MNDLRELYQEVIVDHTKSPRNFGVLDTATHHAEGYNPLCGDKLSLFLRLDNESRIEAIRFIGEGCSISTASASLMTEALRGKTVAEAEALLQDFHHMLTQASDASNQQRLGKLAILAGVAAYPARVKCATLAWHTLEAALHRDLDPVSTE